VRDGRIPKLQHANILSYEEILHIVKIGIDLGITKVRITGGEPLVRKNAVRFLEALTALDGLQDVSLTTNGILLGHNIDRIAAAGIKRINISLDSLKPDKFKHITGYDHFERVWSGILRAQCGGFKRYQRR
jgi:cyclic pyranopterin phosphate synthase